MCTILLAIVKNKNNSIDEQCFPFQKKSQTEEKMVFISGYRDHNKIISSTV